MQSITDAARLVDAELRWADAQMEMATRMGAPMGGVRKGIHDPMAPIDSLVDSEATRGSRLQHALWEVDEAKAVFSGMRCVRRSPRNCSRCSSTRRNR